MELRQSKNNAVVVGTLMDMEVRNGVTSTKGDNYVSVTLKVSSIINGVENETEVKLFATEKQKNFQSYNTIASEYNSFAKTKSRELADTIRVTGTLVNDKYANNKTGKISQSKKINGLNVSRVDRDKYVDEVGINLECVIVGYKNELDADGIETGRLDVDLLTVGYKNNIGDFTNVKVGQEDGLAEAFSSVYNIGDTTLLSIHMFNFSDNKEKEVEETRAFGKSLSNKAGSFTNFTRELVIIGGNAPSCEEGFFYTDEEIEYMKKLVELKNDELMKNLKDSGSGNVTMNRGFGQTNQSNQQQTPPPVQDDNFGDDDIPF